MDETSFSQSLRFMLELCTGLRKCYDNRSPNAFLIGPITDEGMRTVGTPGRMLVSLVDEFILVKKAADSLLASFATRNNDECFSRGLLSKSWHEEALNISNQTIVALQRFDSPWMRVSRNRFRDGTITEDYPAELKDKLVDTINQAFLATVDTEMERMPAQRQIAFVMVCLERELNPVCAKELRKVSNQDAVTTPIDSTLELKQPLGPDEPKVAATVLENEDTRSVTRYELVNHGKKTKGLLNVSTSRLSQMIKDEGFPKPFHISGRDQYFLVNQVNAYLREKGKSEIKLV